MLNPQRLTVDEFNLMPRSIGGDSVDGDGHVRCIVEEWPQGFIVRVTDVPDLEDEISSRREGFVPFDVQFPTRIVGVQEVHRLVARRCVNAKVAGHRNVLVVDHQFQTGMDVHGERVVAVQAEPILGSEVPSSGMS